MTRGSAGLIRAPHRSSIRWALMAFACLGPALSHAQAPVAAPAPSQSIPEMSYEKMAHLMEMDDTQMTGMLLLDQLEWRDTSPGATAAWEGEGWYGGDYDKLGVRTEGEEGDATEDARIEAFWDRIVTRWWSVQVGAREDVSGGPSRTWVGVGLEGLAPEWLHVEATLYAGESGRTAARLWSTYDVLITQRLILQPELEANLYGKADPARHLGSGLSDLEAGLRLRYEFRREIAPYVGVVWQRLCGDTADFARTSAERTGGAEFTAGIRVWL
ncbi:MAG TPA: copper resistance protein B [Steroidobacteraceae bacterium]|nr:copper resistance protein B [Steroidobacteraceae bacterium]